MSNAQGMRQQDGQHVHVKDFQFIHGRPAMPAAEDKENALPAVAVTDAAAAGPNGSHIQIPVSPVRAPPSTPATRLPLAELLGGGDESGGGSPKRPTPEDHITWRSRPSPKSSRTSASMSAKTPATGLKRARSSSPPSTTQRKAARTVLADPPNLETPRLDPAADLWAGYAVRTGLTELGAGTSALSLLAMSGSPAPNETQAQASSVSGLRRWTSCGVQWPSSRTKRRKVAHAVSVAQEIDGLFADVSHRADPRPEAPRPSKFPSLIKRIEDCLANPRKQQPAQDEPSSSSPEVGTTAQKRDANSPTRLPPARRSKDKGQDAEQAARVPQNGHSAPPNSHTTGQPTVKDPSSSSFGGGSELDDALLESPANLETGVGRQAVSHAPEAVSEQGDDEFGLDELVADDLMEEIEGGGGNEVGVKGGGEDDDDEFGDADMSAVDFEHVSLQMQSQQQLQEQPKLPEVQVAAVADDDFGDDVFDDSEFGDVDDSGLGSDIEALQAAEDAAAAATAAAEKASTSGPNHPSPLAKTNVHRCVVRTVVDGCYTEHGHELPEKILVVELDIAKPKGTPNATATPKAVSIRQSWLDNLADINKGDIVNVIGDFHHGLATVDDAAGWLVVHPDQLVSALVVADSFSCARRAALQDRVKASGGGSVASVRGTMLHELVQAALERNEWSAGWLAAEIDGIVARHVEDVYEVKETLGSMSEQLKARVPALQAWAGAFVRVTPLKTPLYRDGTMAINALLDVEEHVWSPVWGLKGNVDATVRVRCKTADQESESTLTVPLEVKTGRGGNASHRAQTALYTLLLGDRYDVDVACGLLYYLESGETQRIPALRHELRAMVAQRNMLATFAKHGAALPPMLKQQHACGRCYAQAPCFVYHRLAEAGDGETSGLGDVFEQAVKHLGAADRAFFVKWDDLLTKEEKEMRRWKRELWTMASAERERHGRCFARVVIDGAAKAPEPAEAAAAAKMTRFRYTFRRAEPAGPSFNESALAVGEPIVVSDEAGHYALALGYVVELSRLRVSVAVDRRLHNARQRQRGFDAATNQAFGGIMELVPGFDSSAADALVVYRIDKDEFSNGLAAVRNNLIALMTDQVFHARDLRRLIVAGEAPRFRPSDGLPSAASQQHLNADQRAAIDKIATAQDYALVLGMPGTGKTTTIAHIIRTLVGAGKTVLLASYTHSAVDNILLKLELGGADTTLRLGAAAKVHPDVRRIATLAAEPGAAATTEQVERTWHGAQVVATTCLGITHALFKERVFDYCIVDEASQITMPVCLGPIRMAKVFVLVGDHYQLPPLVQNREAQEGGLEVSLFRQLTEAHPEAVVTLRHQYRMNASIMSIANTLVYSGQLVCGSAGVAEQVLELPDAGGALAQLHGHAGHVGSGCWLEAVLAADRPVVFFNTDALPAAETAQGVKISNPLEAELAAQAVQALLLAGADARAVGVITLYRSQLALIKATLARGLGAAQLDHVEAHTADRYQGRDKDTIVISFVRSNERDHVGDLLKDWRRVNVAVTRARKKLVLIGSKRTLSRGDELLRQLVELCEDRGWMYDLAAGADEGHAWPAIASVATQAPLKDRGSPRRGSDKQSLSQIHHDNDTGNASLSSMTVKTSTALSKPFKMPAKQGHVTRRAVLGGSSANTMASRPVLADLMHEILGTENGY